MRAWLLKVVQSVAIILMLAIALWFLMQHKDPGAQRCKENKCCIYS